MVMKDRMLIIGGIILAIIMVAIIVLLLVLTGFKISPSWFPII